MVDQLGNRYWVTAFFPSCGGGAAVGNNGQAPTPNSFVPPYYGSTEFKYTPGVAGNGATPTRAAFGNYYGEGGCGGHGGGGGGGQGDMLTLRRNTYTKHGVGEVVRVATQEVTTYEIMSLSAPGQGGNGGQAGNGQGGCVVIYY